MALNGPGGAGVDGEDNDGDGIVDNENCDVVCPVYPVPGLIGGGGLPGVRPPAPKQTPAPKPSEPEQPKVDDRRDRGDGRDSKGRYANGNDGRSGKDEEKRILDNAEKRFGAGIIRDQRQATIEGGKQSRYYDGLIPNGDGTYSGIEVKSGGARKTPGQRDFDERVRSGTPATVKLPDGTTVKITNVIDLP
ncbi:hypothetical protein VZC37_15290 [Gordonia sp. LSe1-13]|uniref:Tox-REase-7 domain-containing protein n=2 Tax=Gordonia TaxID=2053 RepID=A0ABU7MGP3_9ACTN|nr:hypothetical protein [Gordonia sp. LSe1-13]MEE4026019.1 hypothetical protein [Gordonia sp. PKS22-38]